MVQLHTAGSEGAELQPNLRGISPWNDPLNHLHQLQQNFGSQEPGPGALPTVLRQQDPAEVGGATAAGCVM